MIGKTELEAIVSLIGFPCNRKESEKTIRENATEWCEKNCGRATAEQCWQKYFEIKRRYKNARKNY